MRQLHDLARQHGRTLLVLDTRQGDPSELLYRKLRYARAGVIPPATHGVRAEHSIPRRSTICRFGNPSSILDIVHPKSTRMSAAAWMVAIVVAIAGCRADPTAAVARAIPTPVDRTARTFLAALRNGNLAAAESLVVAPQRGSAAVRAAIGQMATTFGRAAPDSLRPLNVAAFFGGGASRVRVTYEVAYPDRWVIAGVDVLDSAGIAQVIGAHADAIPRSAVEANALTLRGKSAAYYVLALFAIVLPLFMFVTAIQVVRRRVPRRWLWAVAALVGVGKLSLNWTTGAIGFQPLQFQLFGSGIIRAGGPYLPWFLSVAFPLGAVVAQFRMRRAPDPQAGQSVVDATPPEAAA